MESGGDDESDVNQAELCRAAEKGHIAVVKRLLEAKADINGVDVLLWTPLMGATAYGRLDMMKFLIASRADASVKTHGGRTALDIGLDHSHYTQRHNRPCIELLRDFQNIKPPPVPVPITVTSA